MPDRIAKIISSVFHPLFLAFAGVILIRYNHFIVAAKLTETSGFFFMLIFFLSLVAVPIIGLMLLFRKQHPAQLASLNKQERTLSAMVMMVLYGFMAISFDSLFIDPILRYYLIALAIVSGLSYVLDRVWGLSYHMMGWGSFCAFLFIANRFSNHSIDLFIVFSFVLAGLTATARLKLKAHSPFEIYLGYSAGLISTAIFFIIVYGF